MKLTHTDQSPELGGDSLTPVPAAATATGNPRRPSPILKIAGIALVLVGISGIVAGWLQSRGGASQDPSDDPSVVLSTDRYDLGQSLEQNTKCKAVVELTNRGNDEVRIVRFEVDCGCTLLLPDRKTLPPGESTAVRATMEIGLNRGPLARRCAIVYRHQREEFDRRKAFVLTGVVVPEFEVSHTVLNFDRAATQTETVSFTPKAGSKLNVAVKGVSARGVSATRLPGDPQDMQQKIAVTFDPREYGGGEGLARVLVSTGNPGQPDFEIKVVIR